METHSYGHPERIGQWAACYLPPVLIVLLALALSLYGLESKSLWHDELGTLTNAGWGGSWLDAIRNPLTVPMLPKPPLPFLLTHISLALDNSVFAARLPAVVFAVLTIPLLYLVGKTFFDRRVGLLAALLLAIAPLHIRYAQEARMYSMLTFFSLLSLYLFWRAIRARQLRWWLGFALVTALNLYTHQMAFLLLGVLILFALWLLLRTRARQDLKSQFPFQGWHFFGALGLSALLYLPMVPYLLEGIMSPEGIGGTPGPVYGELRWNLDSLATGLRLFSSGNDPGMIAYAGLFVLAILVLLVRICRVQGRSTAGPMASGANPLAQPGNRENADCRMRDCYALLLLLAWLVLPLVILLSVPAGHGVRIRYLLFLLPAYLLLVAFGLCTAIQWLASWLAGRRKPAITHRVARIVVAAVLLALLVGIGARTTAAYYAECKQDWQAATEMVCDAAGIGEPIFVSRRHHQTGVRFYMSQQAQAPNSPAVDSVQILPRNPSAELVPADLERAWLIVPVREPYLPGGELDASLKPYYRLSDPVVFEPCSVPRDSQAIGPICFRSLALMQIVRLHPPSIHFAADSESIQAGECTWLRWEVEYVREVYLDGEGVVGRGEREVCPTESATYELEVIHTDGTSTLETIEIEMVSP
jgi:4-amino-4-deoxy-L-arabinose transferase-like glycosyltransferase